MNETTPFNDDLERALLASLLIYNGTNVPVVRRLIQADDFHSELHGQVYKAICALYDEVGHVDYPLLAARMESMGLDAVAPVEWLAKDFHPPAAKAYAQEVFDLAQRRRIIEGAAKQAQAGYQLPGDKALDVAEALLADVVNRAGRVEDGGIAAALEQMQEEEQDASDVDQNGLLGYTTGIPCYDGWSDGLRHKMFHVIGGYTGTGKTRVALTAMVNAAKAGARCLFITLEMPKASIAARIISYLADIDSNKLSKPLGIAEMGRKQEAISTLTALPINILESNRNITLIEAAVAEYQPDCLFIDYIQKIGGDPKLSNYDLLRTVSQRLQDMAIRQKCCIVALSQVSNASLGNTTQVIGFKGAGDIAADSDIAMMLSRDKKDVPNVITFSLEKNRHGQEGREAYWIDLATGRMRNLTVSERNLWKSGK